MPSAETRDRPRMLPALALIGILACACTFLGITVDYEDRAEADLSAATSPPSVLSPVAPSPNPETAVASPTPSFIPTATFAAEALTPSPGASPTSKPTGYLLILRKPAGLPFFGSWAADDLELRGSLPGTLLDFSPDQGTLALLTTGESYPDDFGDFKLLLALEQGAWDTSGYAESFRFAYSPSRDRFAWTPKPGVVEVWDVPQAEQVSRIEGLSLDCCSALNFSPDGKLLAVSDSAQLIWDTTQQRVVLSIPERKRGVFSPDGRYLLVGGVGDNWRLVELWDLTDQQMVFSQDDTYALAGFSPDGKTLAFDTWRDGITVVFLDLETRQEIRSLTGFETTAPIYFMEFSPDWTHLLFQTRGGLTLVDVATGRMASASYDAFSFSPDGSLLAAISDAFSQTDDPDNVFLIDPSTGKVLFSMDHGDGSRMRRMAFSPDSRLLATRDFDDALIRLWYTPTGKLVGSLPACGVTLAVAFSPDQRLLACVAENTTVFWAAKPE